MEAMISHQHVWFHSGLWYSPEYQSSSNLYTIYTIFLVVFLYVPFPLLLTISMFYTTNIDEFIDIFLIWPTAVFGIKASLIVSNRTKIERLFDELQQMDEFVQLDTHRAIVRQQTKQSKCLLWMFSIEYYMSITVHLMIALLAGEIMWPVWVPFDIENVGYWLLNIYLFITSLFNG